MRKRQLAETVPKEVHTVGLLDKDTKTAILNMFKELKRKPCQQN